MPLEDRDIFQAVWERFSDQPIELVMEQYEKARRLNLDIEKRMGAIPPVAPTEVAAVAEETEEETVETVPARRKYTKRHLKVKPENAITDNAIICCLCGAERQSLTSKHLAAHDITVDEYKKLCGYPPNQALMSGQRHAKSRENIVRAQKARISKRAAEAAN